MEVTANRNIQEINSFENPFSCPIGDNLSEKDFENIELNNTVNAYPINIIKEELRGQLDESLPFKMTTILKSLITPEQINSFETYMPYAIQEAKKNKKDICLQNRLLIGLFSSFPTSIIFYLIQIYLYILNNRFKDSLFYHILSNIQNGGEIDEVKYTAYNFISPFDLHNETNGNDFLVNHLRYFFNIQSCYQDYNDARERQLFFGFIKSGPKQTRFMRFVSKLTKKFTNVGGHMNSFIIDKEKKIIVHFEPKGKGMSAYQPFNFKQFICRVAGIDYIVQGESNILDINGFKYTYMDTKSFQMVQTPLLNFDIFCQTYSIMAILIYILNIEQIRALPPVNILDLYKSINQNHAIYFMNFFYDICKDDYFHINKIQSRDATARYQNVVEINNNNITGGYYRKTKKYNKHRKLTKAKIRRSIYKNKIQTTKS
jgi:hypothetical protein